MRTYTELIYEGISAEQSDILIARLSALEFDGFQEVDGALKAFIPSEAYRQTEVDALSKELNVAPRVFEMPEVNWNEVWESNFSPVTVGNFCAIRADFHEPISGVRHEIVITPKMSFGTGHHHTTNLMIQKMEKIDIAGRSVLDFGTGTGVLAILAAMMGARRVLAIDNDDWSIDNATENCQRNNIATVEVRKGDSADVHERFDIILANIIKNVIIENISGFVNSLNPGGILLVSGLLKEDVDDVLRAVGLHGFKLHDSREQSGWFVLQMKHAATS